MAWIGGGRMAHRYGAPVRVATDALGRPVRFTWRGVPRRCEVVGEWRLVSRWWVTPAEVEALRSAGRPALGATDRAYYRVLTPDCGVYELYRDDAAGGAWVLDVVRD